MAKLPLTAPSTMASPEPETDQPKAKAKTPTIAKPEGRSDPLAAAVNLATMVDRVNAAYVGPSGSGKTTAVCAMANLSEAPTFVVNAEGGLKRSALARMGVAVDRIQVLPAEGQALTFDYLEDVWLSAKGRLQDDPESINGFVWDSVTEIHRKLLRNVVEGAVSKAEKQGKARDPFFTDLADYGVMSEQVLLLLRRFRDLDCHFAMTALERRDKDGDGKVVINPNVTPALIGAVLGWPDVVLYTSVDEVAGYEEYRGLSRPIGKFRGKDRFKVLPKTLIDPTFDRVAGYVYESLDLESDPVMQAARELRRKSKIEELDTADEGDDE